MTDQEIIATTIGSMNAAMAVRTRDRRKRKLTDGLEVVDAWDRSVAALLAGIAKRHANSPHSTSSGLRGCCTTCRFFDGERCPDMADALAVCAAWNAAMADETIQLGLQETPCWRCAGTGTNSTYDFHAHRTVSQPCPECSTTVVTPVVAGEPS